MISSALALHHHDKLEFIALRFENLFLNYLPAPSAFIAFRTFQGSSRSSVHRKKRLLIGRYDLVAAILALVGTHADFEL